MKYFQLSLAAGILALVLATPVPAGDMPLGAPQQSGQSQATVMGDMPMGGAVAGAPTVTEIALALMQSALLLF